MHENVPGVGSSDDAYVSPELTSILPSSWVWVRGNTRVSQGAPCPTSPSFFLSLHIMHRNGNKSESIDA